MNITVNPFKFQTAKILEKCKKDREVHAGECPTAGVNIHSSKKIVQSGTTIIDVILFKPKRSGSTKVVQSSSLLDIRTDIQAKKILSKVRSGKDNITKLFKTSDRVSPDISNLGPFAIPGVHQHCVQDVHPSPPFQTSISQSAISRVRAVTVFDPIPSGQTRLDTIASLVPCSEHVAEEHVEDFVFILRSVAEVPSPSSSVHLLTAPHSQRALPSTFLPNKLHTNEEQVGNSKVDAEGVPMEPNRLAVTGSCLPFRTSDSEAKYDAMLAAEFATFSFDSDDILEWSDEVEREKQARMDAHFAYVSEALAAPVPKLSAYFSADSPADFTNVDKDGFINGHSPLKTETSGTNTSSADSSLVTSIDAEDSRPSPIIVRGLRRVRNHGDLRNLHLITDCSDSCSDLSCWSIDVGLSDSTATGTKTGALRRSVKYNDLRKSFSSLEHESCLSLLREIRANKD